MIGYDLYVKVVYFISMDIYLILSSYSESLLMVFYWLSYYILLYFILFYLILIFLYLLMVLPRMSPMSYLVSFIIIPRFLYMSTIHVLYLH